MLNESLRAVIKSSIAIKYTSLNLQHLFLYEKVRITQKYIVRKLYKTRETADRVYQRSEKKCCRLKTRICFIIVNTRNKNFLGRGKVHGSVYSKVHKSDCLPAFN